MSDSKVYMFPESGNSQIDPNLLMALNNNGGFGGNGNWLWIIFIFLLFGWRGNGLFGGNGIDSSIAGTGYLSNQIMNGSGRDLLMQAIQGNRDAVTALSNQLNTNVGNIQTAVNQLLGSVTQVGNQVGMNALQTINAIQAGNQSLGQQIAQCCCDNKLLVTSQGYENQLATLNQTNTLQNTANLNANALQNAINTSTNVLQNAINNDTVKTQEGFTTVTFQNQTQQAATQRSISDGVQNLKDATNAQTSSILAKLDAIEDDRKNREISNLTAQLAAVTAKAEREAELQPIIKQLDAIQCHQPSTVTTQYSPFTAVPNCVAWQMGYGLNPFNNNGTIWS